MIPCLYQFLHWIRGHRYTRRLILRPISAARPRIDLCTKKPPASNSTRITESILTMILITSRQWESISFIESYRKCSISIKFDSCKVKQNWAPICRGILPPVFMELLSWEGYYRGNRGVRYHRYHFLMITPPKNNQIELRYLKNYLILF